MTEHEKFFIVFSDLLEGEGLTRKQFAIKSEIPLATVLGWTNKGRLPDYTALIKIANFFDCSLDYLMGRTDDFVKIVENMPQKPKLRVDVNGLDKADVQLLQAIADRLKKQDE